MIESYESLWDKERQRLAISQKKWDLRFLDLAEEIASWSKDPSTKCGAVITEERRVVSLGFNGFPQGTPDDPELYADREEKYSRIIHAEINASIFARQPLAGCTLYTWPFMCCDRCVVQMIQAGIDRFVYPKASEDAMSRWADSLRRADQYMHEAGVEFTEYAEVA